MPQVIQLCGGLGNQMFQYAYALSLKYWTGSHDGIYLDLQWFDDVKSHRNVTVRKFDLSRFGISLPVLPDKNRALLLKNAKGRKCPHLLSKLLHVKKYSKVFLMQEMIPCGANSEKLGDDGYFHGLVCRDDYFRHLRKELLQDLVLKERLNKANTDLLIEMQSSNSVALHVRRTDFITTPGLNICSRRYYKKAMNLILKSLENVKFYIFSDDPKWVVDNMDLNSSHTLVDLNDNEHGFIDFWLMKHCRHHIIANSTFSWWGAWLCESDNHIVVAPMPGEPAASKNAGDIAYPSSWKRIRGW